MKEMRRSRSARGPRIRSIDKALAAFNASGPRDGRIRRQVRRAFIAAGRPMTMNELLRWAYPRLKRHECWHRWSVRRALLKIAKPIGRSSVGGGAPGIWTLNCP